MKPVAVYTALFGSFFSYAEPAPGGGFDAFVFSDRKVGVTWAMKKTARHVEEYYKIKSHLFFGPWEFSVWVAGALKIVNADISALVEKYLADADLAVLAHPRRDCLYKEAEARAKAGDTGFRIRDQMTRYMDAGYPPHNGLAETDLILRRNGSNDLRHFEELWWAEVVKGARASLSFNFVAWKMGLKYAIIPGTLASQGFMVREMRRERETV